MLIALQMNIQVVMTLERTITRTALDTDVLGLIGSNTLFVTLRVLMEDQLVPTSKLLPTGLAVKGNLLKLLFL